MKRGKREKREKNITHSNTRTFMDAKDRKEANILVSILFFFSHFLKNGFNFYNFPTKFSSSNPEKKKKKDFNFGTSLQHKLRNNKNNSEHSSNTLCLSNRSLSGHAPHLYHEYYGLGSRPALTDVSGLPPLSMLSTVHVRAVRLGRSHPQGTSGDNRFDSNQPKLRFL